MQVSGLLSQVNPGFRLIDGWWLVLVAAVVVAGVYLRRFAHRLYDEARRDTRNQGRYSIVQRRVTRRFFELLRSGDAGAIMYLAVFAVGVLIILSLGGLFRGCAR